MKTKVERNSHLSIKSKFIVRAGQHPKQSITVKKQRYKEIMELPTGVSRGMPGNALSLTAPLLQCRTKKKSVSVGLLGDPYIKGVPLHRIPSYRVPVRDSQLPRTATAASVWPCTTAHVPRVASTARLSLLKCAIWHLQRRLITI